MRRCLIAALLVLGILGCEKRDFGTFRANNTEDHYVKTVDGWRLHILHYKLLSPENNSNPVILCHGLSHNNTFWDLTEKTSLALYLQRAGFDVWSVSLRGAGESTKPTISQIKQLFRLNLSGLKSLDVADVPEDLQKLDWTVDDQINKDVPATINYVLKQTGAKKVHWIGHSLGSMIMFAYLGTIDQSKIDTFIAISAPMYCIRPLNDVYEMMIKQSNFVKIGNIAAGTNLRAVIGTLAGGLLENPVDHLFLNEDNVDAETFHAFYYYCQDDISPGQLNQLLKYLKTGHFVSMDGKIDYTASVANIKVPVLQIVGQLDNMISPGLAKVVYTKIGSKDKDIRIFGTINGYRSNYGHDDIIIGRHAREDVFPYIKSWLDKHHLPES